jgi:hypothetical protein
MPIDERWDHVSDEDWSGFAKAWVEQLRSGRREGERDWDETVTMMNFTARPQQQWKFIVAAAAVAESDDELGYIAAGPIEHLLGRHGAEFIAKVEELAATDKKFARAMTGVEKYTLSDEIWARVQALQSHTTPLRYFEGA